MTENLILQNLIFNEEYSRKVIPYIKEEYFQDRMHRNIFIETKKFILEYNTSPSKNAVKISLENRKDISENEFKETIKFIDELIEDKKTNKEWLINKTEEFCKERAIYNSILESINIIDGKSEIYTETAIPNILTEALSVSFDAHVGHDYIEDADDRYEFYHKVENKIPFDLDFMNKITNGGTPAKTLNIIMAGTGVGKSLFLCHHAANCLLQNLNVLYITCEMAEEKIAERIDANIGDITLDDLRDLPYEMYRRKIDNATKGVSGKLIIKEYPTATANANHFRNLLDELNLKKQFKPDIIFIDYLNICASSRLKAGGNTNSYMYVKSIAEELRGLAVERNVPVFSATQVNRSGFASSDFGLEDTSESFGLPATADFMFAMIGTEELDEQGQVMVKQLKNRYNSTAINRKFILTIDRAKMKLSDTNTDDSSLIQSNQSTGGTLESSGFDGKNFDNNFSVPRKEKISEWKV